MGTRIFMAVMHCAKKAYDKIVKLGVSVGDLMYANVADYAHPPRSKDDFLKIVNDAAEAQALTKGKGKYETSDRNDKLGILFNVLKKEYLPYVNGLYMGDKTKLLLSGMDVNDEPMAHSIPEKRSIRRVIKGPVPLSAKVELDRNKGVDVSKTERLTYYLFQTDDLTKGEEGLKEVLSTTN